MKPAILIAAAALMLPGMAAAQITHFPAGAGPNGAPPFSGSVMVGNTLYVSGTTDGGFKDGDTNTAAAKRVLDNIKRTVETAGLTMDNVVKTTVFLQHMSDFAAMNAVYAEFFTEGQYPARSAVEVGALPRGALVEIETICVK